MRLSLYKHWVTVMRDSHYCTCLVHLVRRSTDGIISTLPLIYTNSQNRSNFCCPSKKDRKISIFPSDFVQSDPILAVRLNRGLVQGRQLYRAFPFSKGSLAKLFPGQNIPIQTL